MTIDSSIVLTQKRRQNNSVWLGNFKLKPQQWRVTTFCLIKKSLLMVTIVAKWFECVISLIFKSAWC